MKNRGQAEDVLVSSEGEMRGVKRTRPEEKAKEKETEEKGNTEVKENSEVRESSERRTSGVRVELKMVAGGSYPQAMTDQEGEEASEEEQKRHTEADMGRL